MSRKVHIGPLAEAIHKTFLDFLHEIGKPEFTVGSIKRYICILFWPIDNAWNSGTCLYFNYLNHKAGLGTVAEYKAGK